MHNKNTSFKTRLLSSICIVAFFAIFFILSWLGDVNNNWSIVPQNYRNIFGWITMGLFILIIWFANKEINNIFFLHDKQKLLLWFSLSLIIFLSISSIILTINYGFMNSSNNSFIFLLSFFLIFLISCIFIGFYLKWIKMQVKDIFAFMFLFQIFNLFCVSFLYLSVIKSWSTLLIIFLVPVLTDTFAYLGGALFGKRKLAPYTSPKKTIEGAIVGVIFAVGISLIILLLYSLAPKNNNMLKNFLGIDFKKRFDTILPNESFANRPLWWINSTIILLCLSIFSIVGDLSFSAIKRNYNIKDFSNLIPGHGGILDRLDSHTFVYSSFFIISITIGFLSRTAGIF